MLTALIAAAVLRGPFPLLVTPWTEDAKLDVPVLVREAEYVNRCGTGGIIWPTAPEIKDLDAAGEYEAGLTALAERAVRPGAEFAARITATCAGTNAAACVAQAAKVEAVAKRTGAAMAILARPPDDATNQTMIAAYYRALAKATTQPVIIQTYNGKSPQPDVSLLVELAKEFPDIYGHVKEESPGDKVNDRMAELLTHPEIKGVFSGWGGKGWVYQGARIGTCGVISQRPAYASLFVKIWNRLAAGADASDPELADAYAKYLYMVNLGDIFSKWGDDEMRGPHLHALNRLGIFTNTLSREGPGKVKSWPMTDAMKAEIDARLAYAGILPPKRPRVALYMDRGCRGSGAYCWAQLLMSSPDLDFAMIDADGVRRGDLAGYDVLVMPGGGGFERYDDWGEDGCEKIRDFIRRGGKYLGTCAGMSVALNEEKRIRLIPYKRDGHALRGGMNATVRLTDRFTELTGVKPDLRTIRYHNGPCPVPADPVPGVTAEVIATYDCTVMEKGEMTSSMRGKPAVIWATLGEGRMFIFGCHPENYAENLDLVRGAFKALVGFAPSFPKRQIAGNPHRIAFYASEIDDGGDTADTVWNAVRSAARPDADVTPVTGEELAQRALEHAEALVLPGLRTKKLSPRVQKLIEAFVARGGKVTASVAAALPVDPSDAWPSMPTKDVKAELVAYARQHGHAEFAAKIAAQKNKTDWIGATLDYGTKLLKACEGRDFRDAERRTALELIDYPLHVDNYSRLYATVAETNAWEAAVRDHLAAAKERVLAECAAAEVPEGSLRLWRIYNMAYLVKGPRHTVLIDLPKRPYIDGLWTEKDFARFAEIADVFVLTHPHRDHYCPEILQAFLARKKSVVLPCDLKLNDANAHVLDTDHAEPVEIGGVKFRNFLGNQGKGVPCNVYWMDIDGVRVADNGDNYVKEQERRLAACPPVDVIIAATWNGVTHFVGSCAAAPGFDRSHTVFLPSHENELGHSVAHREGYRRMYANPDRLGAPGFAWPQTIPLHWGESVTVGRNNCD